MTRGQLYGLHVLLCLVLSHAAFALSSARPLFWLLFAALLAYGLAGAGPPARTLLPAPPAVRPPRALAALIGLAIALPVLLYLAASWQEELPLRGDHEYHIGISYRTAFFWASPAGSPIPAHMAGARPAPALTTRALLAAAIALVTAFLVHRGRPRAALACAAAALCAWGLADHYPYARYPAGSYLLDLPFDVAMALTHAQNMGEGPRLGRVASVLAWLFVLRPLLLRRWPDAALLPWAALFYWQSEIVFHVASSYLEAWEVVCVLLAAEALLDGGPEAAPLACLLAGAGACFKEFAILVLPFAWLAGRPWQGPAARRLDHLAAGLAGGLPFVAYHSARVASGEDRQVAPHLDWHTLTSNFPPFFARLHVQYGTPGLALLVAAIALTAAYAVRGPRRLETACVFLAGGTQIALTYFDAYSLPWLGYPRFTQLGLALLPCGLLLLGRDLQRRPWLCAAAAAIVLAAHAPRTAALIALAHASGPARNSYATRDGPLYLPLAELLAQARRDGALAGVDRVTVNAVPGVTGHLDAPLMNLPVPLSFEDLPAPRCRCDPDHRAVMITYVAMTNLAAGWRAWPADPDGPCEFYPQWRDLALRAPADLAALRASADRVYTTTLDGQLTGALGIRNR